MEGQDLEDDPVWSGWQSPCEAMSKEEAVAVAVVLAMAKMMWKTRRFGKQD